MFLDLNPLEEPPPAKFVEVQVEFQTRVFFSGSLALAPGNIARFMPLEDELENGAGCRGAADADSSFGAPLVSADSISISLPSEITTTQILLGAEGVYGLCLARAVVVDGDGLVRPVNASQAGQGQSPSANQTIGGRRRAQEQGGARKLTDEDFEWRPDMTIAASGDVGGIGAGSDALTAGLAGLSPAMLALLGTLLALLLCCCCCLMYCCLYRRREAAKRAAQHHRRGGIDQGRPRELRDSFKQLFGIAVRPPSISARETDVALELGKISDENEEESGAISDDEIVTPRIGGQDATRERGDRPELSEEQKTLERNSEAMVARLGGILSAEPPPPPETLDGLRTSLMELDEELKRKLLPAMPIGLREQLDAAYARLDELRELAAKEALEGSRALSKALEGDAEDEEFEGAEEVDLSRKGYPSRLIRARKANKAKLDAKRAEEGSESEGDEDERASDGSESADEDDEDEGEEVDLAKEGHPSRLRRARKANAVKLATARARSGSRSPSNKDVGRYSALVEGADGEMESDEVAQLLEIADLQADINELTLQLKRQILSTADVRISDVRISEAVGSSSQAGLKYRAKPTVTFISQGGSSESMTADEGEAEPRISTGIFGRMFSIIVPGRTSQSVRDSKARESGARSTSLFGRLSKYGSAKLRVKKWPEVKPPPPPPGRPPQKPIEPRSRGFFYHIFGGLS